MTLLNNGIVYNVLSMTLYNEFYLCFKHVFTSKVANYYIGVTKWTLQSHNFSRAIGAQFYSTYVYTFNNVLKRGAD